KGIAQKPALYADYALTLLKNGKLQDAEAIGREVIALLEAEPDKLDVLDTGRCRRIYGEVLIALGKRDEAKRFTEGTIARQLEQLGPTHPETQASLSAYVDLLEAMGLLREALEVHRELLEIDQKLGREEDLGYFWRQAKAANLLLV